MDSKKEIEKKYCISCKKEISPSENTKRCVHCSEENEEQFKYHCLVCNEEIFSPTRQTCGKYGCEKDN